MIILNEKSNFINAIKGFIIMAKTQFDKQVKIIRSDNAKEFDDKHCRPYFTELAIIHQTSCINTPQQNDRAERKHRNLLEMARVLRFQAGLPPQY